MNNIGLKIKLLREKNSLSQEKLAYHLDISQGCLCRIESGQTDKVDFILMQKVCELFGVNFEYFLENNVLQINKDNKNSAFSIFGNTTVHNTTPEHIIEAVFQNQKLIFEIIFKQNQLLEDFIKKS